MRIDPTTFGGELEQRLKNYARLEQDHADRQAEARRAVEAVKEAAGADMAAEVRASLEGKQPPEATWQAEAEEAAQAAQRAALVADRAYAAARDAVVAEAEQESYREVMDEREQSIAQVALSTLEILEGQLVEIGEVRAYKAWLKQPLRGSGMVDPVVEDVWIGDERLRKPNGDAARSRELTFALRQALLGEDRVPEKPKTGLPVGQLLSGPWGVAEPTAAWQRKFRGGETMSAPAAKIFEELLAGDGAEPEDE